MYGSSSPAVMQQEVSRRPLVEPHDDGSSTKGVRPKSPLVLRPPCPSGSPDSGRAPEVASWYWLESRCCICCVQACVPLAMPGVWAASVACRRTGERDARLHVCAIANTRPVILDSIRCGCSAACFAGAFSDKAMVFHGLWRSGALLVRCRGVKTEITNSEQKARPENSGSLR